MIAYREVFAWYQMPVFCVANACTCVSLWSDTVLLEDDHDFGILDAGMPNLVPGQGALSTERSSVWSSRTEPQRKCGLKLPSYVSQICCR